MSNTGDFIKFRCNYLLVFILLFNAVLYTVGVNWGLPNTTSWMADSLAPWDPLVGLTQAFSFGYFNKYPMMHQLLLAILYLPMVIYAIASHADPAGFQLYQFLHYVRSADFATVLIYIGRFVSVAMGVGTVYYLYRAVRELFDEQAGLWAAVLLSFNTVLNFYSHTAKVEVPHIFWTMVALYYLIRVIRYDERKEYVYTTVFACMAFGTKDQAYAVFVLPFILYLFVLPVLHREEGKSITPVLFRRNMLIFVAVFVIGTLFAENIILNWEGFLYRVKHLTGEGGTRSIHYTLDCAGIWALWRDVFRGIMIDAMGVPAFILSLGGVALLVIRRKDERKNILVESVFLIAMFSFMLFFVQIIRQSTIRFVMIQSILFTAYGGYALARIMDCIREKSWPLKSIVIVLLAAGGVYSFYNTVSVNVRLLRDARYNAEAWMNTHIPKGAVIEYYTYTHYLPRFPEGADACRIKKNLFEIDTRRPDYLVLNSTMIEKNLSLVGIKYGKGQMPSVRNLRALQSGMPDFVGSLMKGALGFKEVHRSSFDPGIFRRHHALNISSDYIVVFKRKTDRD